jgi:basic amino acid/polyamine antiporter, APA family
MQREMRSMMGFWSKKSILTIQSDSEETPYRLKRTLGPIDLMMLGIGAIIGAGLFSITGIAAAENAGPAIVLSFIIAAIGCAFAGMCYCELATMIPISGSAYTYAYVSMGEFIAWIIGWNLILEYAIGAATVSISWSAYVVALLYDFGIYLPPYLIASPWQPVNLPDGSQVFGLINLPAFLIVAALSFVLIGGIKQSSWVNAIIVTIKISVVLAFIGLGFFYINPENYHPFIPENTGNFGEYGFSGIMRAAGVVFFAYIGFDAVSTAVQETKNLKKSIPIGILGSLLVCTILYILFAGVMTGLVNYKELDVAAPVAVAIDKTPFWWLHWIIKLGVICGFTSVILVMMLGQSRIFYAMSCDGLLPLLFSKIHPKYHTPWLCNLFLLFFVGLVGAFAPLAVVGHMTSIGTLLAFTIVCAGVLILRYKHPEIDRPYRVPWVPLIPLMGMGVCLAMMAYLGLATWIRLIVWIAIGIFVYLFYGRYHSVLRNNQNLFF